MNFTKINTTTEIIFRENIMAKWAKIHRYTSWDSDAVEALWMYGFSYDIWDDNSWEKVTTLNRIKHFLEDVWNIQKPTKNLVMGILDYTNTGRYIWRGIDTTNNICNLFVVHIENFKASIENLINIWELKTE